MRAVQLFGPAQLFDVSTSGFPTTVRTQNADCFLLSQSTLQGVRVKSSMREFDGNPSSKD
jgi:hypothetical protein